MVRDNSNRIYLLNLLERYGSLNISELSELIGISRPSIYQHLEVLEKQGLIKREKEEEKKGTPVKVYPLIPKFIEKEKEDMLKYLKFIEKEKEVPQKEGWDFIRKEFKSNIGHPACSGAILLGLVESKTYLTEEGKKFLKENEC